MSITFAEQALAAAKISTDAFRITELFFVGVGLFVTALAAARTEPLKTGLSVMGGLVCLAWWRLVSEGNEIVDKESEKILYWLPLAFASAWLFSAAIHFYHWMNQGCCVKKRIRVIVQARAKRMVEETWDVVLKDTLEARATSLIDERVGNALTKEEGTSD